MQKEKSQASLIWSVQDNLSSLIIREIYFKEIDSGGVTAIPVIPRPRRTRYARGLEKKKYHPSTQI